MRRYSPYRSPPRRGYGGRGRSPPPRSPPRRRGGYGGRREQNSGSLLVRNIPLSCRPDELRAPFERFGPVRDVYLPKDYYSGEPRGFGFVQFVDPYDASEAQYHMNGQLFGGRELTVVLAAETRKRPEEMRHREGPRGPPGGRRQSYYHGRSRSPSRSRSPRRTNYSSRRRSRSYSPAPRKHERAHSVSPPRKESALSRSRSRSPGDRRQDRRSYSPEHEFGNSSKNPVSAYDGNGSVEGGDGRHSRRRSPSPDSPPGSRSRSADPSPRRR